MPYDPLRHRRRSSRLRGYDYASPGAYYVTLNVQDRRELFGRVSGGQLVLSAAGEMVSKAWRLLAARFATLALDAFVVMPDHLHALAILGAPAAAAAPTLGAIIGAYKSLTTNAYAQQVAEAGWPPFDRCLWQRNYYEHIVRDEAAMLRIRRYIEQNPARWVAAEPRRS